mgnify:CR=1 FL=1
MPSRVGPGFVLSLIYLANTTISGNGEDGGGRGVSAVASASELGDESVSAAANVAVTGNVGTSALGTESLSTNNILDVTGFVGTSALGSVTPKANADVTITEGFEITSALLAMLSTLKIYQGI